MPHQQRHRQHRASARKGVDDAGHESNRDQKGDLEGAHFMKPESLVAPGSSVYASARRSLPRPQSSSRHSMVLRIRLRRRDLLGPVWRSADLGIDRARAVEQGIRLLVFSHRADRNAESMDGGRIFGRKLDGALEVLACEYGL